MIGDGLLLNMENINYCRLLREKTDSFITYQLPEPMAWDSEESYFALIGLLAKLMPGWDLISGSVDNPDEEQVNK